MDKNNCDNNSYFYERNYYKDVPIKDTQILEYWNNILGKDVIESIDKAYGVSIEQILFSEYSLNHKYISFATLNQEYSDMCNEKAISYLTKKGTKVLFDQFVLRFLGYGKRVLERKSRKGYIVKVIQDCFLKNLAERILDVSLSTLIFEMYLAKEQGELRGNDEAEEYNDYNQRFLGNDKYIKELFSIYPGLKRMLIELMENLANNYILLQERMEKDTLLLEDKFGGKKSWTEVKDMMFQYTDDMLERSTDLEKESSGAYAGEASVIYVYEVLYKITGKQKYLEYAEKHCKILEYALKADENNDLIYGNAGAVIVLLNLYHLAQKDIYLQLACEAGNILIKNQNKGKWCCGNGQSLSGLSHGITGIIYALTKLNNEQFHIEYQKAIHSGLIYENTMYSDKYNNWLDNREEAKKEENSDNRCMAAWCHGAPGILLARSKMYNLVKDSSDYITVQCDIERALFATKMYGFTDNDCLCHGNLGNTEILLEYSKECNDEEVRHMMLSARTQIAMDIINENYDCARSYLHGYKIPGFMTGISGMGYSLLRDLYPELPCILALEI